MQGPSRWDRLALAVVTRCDPDPALVYLEVDCDGEYAHTRRILAAVGFSAAAIEATLKYWGTETTNCCDCAALTDETLNALPARGELLRL